jgi:hypothetical protein
VPVEEQQARGDLSRSRARSESAQNLFSYTVLRVSGNRVVRVPAGSASEGNVPAVAVSAFSWQMQSAHVTWLKGHSSLVPKALAAFAHAGKAAGDAAGVSQPHRSPEPEEISMSMGKTVTDDLTSGAPAVTRRTSWPAGDTARSLLPYLALAGPFYVVVSLIQAVTRAASA